MAFVMKQYRDLELEAKSIDNIQKYLEKKFNITLKRTSTFHRFDFISEDESFYFEVKSRRNSRDKYPTTMIPRKKIDYANNHILPKGAQAFFVFHFTDCLTMIKYSPEVFSSFEVKSGGRFDRGCPEINCYCYIPISTLEIQQDYIVA